MNIELTGQEKELLVAIFNSNINLPANLAEVVVSLKKKLSETKAA